MVKSTNHDIISQADLDDLLRINEFIEPQNENSLVEELKRAILDSAKLELEQWQTLRDQLNQVSEDIYQKVADAYVMYKIAEIRGKDKLTLISTELLQEANLALSNAESTRAIIENALFEAKVFEEKL